MVNAQEWLDENYPKKKRSKIKELKIISKNLIGILDLSDFVNLEYLDCSNNYLTELNLSNCSKLAYLEAHKNQLTELKLNENKNINSL